MTIFGRRRVYGALREGEAVPGGRDGCLSIEDEQDRARRQIALKDAEIAALRRELARARGGALTSCREHGPSSSSWATRSPGPPG